MSTASLENSKRLYELSGWDDMPGETSYDWHNMVNDEWELLEKTFFSSDAAKGRHLAEKLYPAYDAGYLLRKLEPLELQSCINYCQHYDGSRNYCASYDPFNVEDQETGKAIFAYADTPEDALCLLAIKLFEEGVL